MVGGFCVEPTALGDQWRRSSAPGSYEDEVYWRKRRWSLVCERVVPLVLCVERETQMRDEDFHLLNSVVPENPQTVD